MTHLPLTRLPDWEPRLHRLVANAHRVGFAWGVRDCCLWAADAARAVTGHDFAADLRGTYRDEAGALEVLRRIGGLRGAAGRAGPRIAPNFAIEGDVGLCRGMNGKACLGVRVSSVWMLKTMTGLVAVPSAVLAWGIGHA